MTHYVPGRHERQLCCNACVAGEDRAGGAGSMVRLMRSGAAGTATVKSKAQCIYTDRMPICSQPSGWRMAFPI